MARKTRTAKPSEFGNGAQFYQSDREAKARKKAGGSSTEMQDLIDQALSERMYSGEITPQTSGRTKSYLFMDSLKDAYSPERRRSTNKKGNQR